MWVRIMKKLNLYRNLILKILSISFVVISCISSEKNDLIQLKKGKEYFFDKNYLKAKEHFINAAKLNPKNDVAIAYAGFCDYYLYHLPSAVMTFDRSLKMNPSNNIALFGKSLVLIEFEDYLGSYILLDSVCDINPKHDKAFYYKASIELLFGDTNSALRNLNIAMRNADDYMEPYYLTSSIYLNLKNEQLADSLLLLANEKKTTLLDSP